MILSKHRELLGVAVRNIGRFRGRTIAIFVPLLIVMMYASAMTFFKDGAIRAALVSISAAPDITVSQLQAGRPVPVTPEFSRNLALSANVERVVPLNDHWDVGLYLKDPDHADEAAGAIHTLYEDAKVATREGLITFVRQDYGRRSGVFQLMWQILLLTALLTAWAQSSSINLEMRKEIGVLKTMGWQTLDIIELKMMEISLIGVAAIFAGMALGAAYLYIGAPFVKEYFLEKAGASAAGVVPVSIELSSVLLLFAIGIFPLCAATIVSAWRMGTVEPDSAIRG